MPTLAIDNRNTVLDKGQYLCLITGVSDKQSGSSISYDGKHQTFWVRWMYPCNPIAGLKAGVYDNVFCFNNSLPMYVNHSGENNDGGVSDMTRYRLTAMTQSYHNYATALKEIGAPIVDIAGFPYDPDFDALKLFEEDNFEAIVGHVACVIKFDPKKVKANSTPQNKIQGWPCRCDALSVQEWRAYIESGNLQVPAGYIEYTDGDDGWLCKFKPYPTDNKGRATVFCPSIVDHRSGEKDQDPELVPYDEILNDPKALLVDSMQRDGKHAILHRVLQSEYNLYYGYRLSVGDYMSPFRNVSVDTKSGLSEFAQNLTEARFEREVMRANLLKCPLHIVVNLEHDDGVTAKTLISDLKANKWVHPSCASCDKAPCTGPCFRPNKEVPLSGSEFLTKFKLLLQSNPYLTVHWVDSEVEMASVVLAIISSAKKTAPAATIINQ